jgi:hypothetical protein
MAAGHLLGLDCKLFRNTATYASPTWDEITQVTDVNVSQTTATGDISSRASTFKLWRPGQKDLTLEFTLRYDSGNTDFTALQSAFTGRTGIDMWVADGASATAGTTGIRANWMITEFSHEQPLEDGVNVKVSAKPYIDATATQVPAYFTVSA